MAQWGVLKDGSGLHNVEIAQTCRNDELCVNLDLPVEFGGVGCKNRVRYLFDQVLSFFLRKVSVNKAVRPIPAILGNGQPADLFKLFWVVRKRGGYDEVSKNKLWGLVAIECGLNVGLVASLKLVFVKYLYELDRSLKQNCRDKSLENGDSGVIEKLDLLSLELEEFRCSFSVGKDTFRSAGETVEFGFNKNGRHIGVELSDNEGGSGEKKSDGKLVKTEFNENGVQMDIDRGLAEVELLDGEKFNKVHAITGSRVNDDDEKFSVQDDNSVVLSAKIVVEKVLSFRNDNNFEKVLNSCNDNGVSISAKSVVDKVLGSRNDNNVEKVLNSCNDNGVPLSAKSVVDKVLRSHNENGVVLSAESVVENVLSSRKRKRESSSFSQMLNWVAHAARNSDDPAVGKIPDSSKWKDYGFEELWMQALMARNALLVGRHVDSEIEESFSQKKMRMHPSMYEDNNVRNQQSTDGLRVSKRLPLPKAPLCPCCNSCAASQNKLHSPRKLEMENNSPKEKNPKINEISTSSMTEDVLFDKPYEKHVSLGPQFQAEVPAWTGIALESDSKWLGTRMWPSLEDRKQKAIDKMDPIGKGRERACDCPFRGSTGCVRFHIAENRMKLKLELGSLFHRWRFNRMGEELSLSWTREEEKRFKDMVSSSPTSMSKFWRNAFKFFPNKTRETLVSYYFNVFVVRRRSYQNRVTPKNIDSDDDEKEFGSVGDSFGYETIHAPNPKLMICFQNMQCTDLE